MVLGKKLKNEREGWRTSKRKERDGKGEKRWYLSPIYGS